MRWIAVVLGLAAPVSAEPLPNLFEVLAGIEGREVQVEGRLVERLPGQGLLLTDNGAFRATYALTREQLSSISRCSLGGAIDASSGCKVRVSAEIVANGSSVDLLVFDLSLTE